MSIFPKDKSGQYILWSAAISTLMTVHFTNSYAVSNTIKVINALVMWINLGLIISKIGSIKRDKFLRVMFAVITLLVMVSLWKTIIYPYMGPGNKWMTMLGNETCILMLLSPLFVFLPNQNSESIIKYLKIVSFFFIVVGILLFFLENRFPYKVLFVIAPFYAFCKGHGKFIVLFSIAIIVYRGFFIEETSRTGLLLVFLVVLSYILTFFLRKKQIVKALCIVFFVMPIIYSIMMLAMPEFSLFEQILPSISKYSSVDESMVADTRTFLFKELADDFTENNAWLFGKGAASHYYSSYFSTTKWGDSEIRFTSEVTFLQLLLRSGLFYVITYYAILGAAIMRGIRKANSDFILFICVLVSEWVFISCVSDLSGCSFIQIGFFALVGLCFSDKWLSYSDYEICKILK